LGLNLKAVDTVLCMGAAISQAAGFYHAYKHTEKRPDIVATIGDSTFFHAGVPALIDAVVQNVRFVLVILDNRTTAMTGHQQHPGTGKTLMGQPTHAVEFEAVARAMGFERVYTVDPCDLAEAEAALRDCLEAEGPAVVISQRACALLPESRREWTTLTVDVERCNGCGLCFQVGCPAIAKSEVIDERTGRAKARIDPMLCTGCEVCAQVCVREAIPFRDQVLESEGV
jgi:indolepyruvate ferredoxin oxidoreductase alpha subunit